MASSPKKPRILDFVITYLEMTGPPKLSVIMPSGRKLALLRAEEPTVSFYRYLYNTVGEPWLWWERRALADDALRAIIEDDKIDVYVLYANGVPAGFAELDRRRLPEIDLAFFGLIPEFIGQGLGRYFLNVIIETAWSLKPRRLTVNTCNFDHPKAIQTYQRAGFVPYDQKHRAVKDPRDIGLISADISHPND
ncbi:MAG: GNAT family N-acetyltransferase [Alphaproteobacteria bacterium]|nr:GNAT family N-acetyltransferase [Alphaproteobacteria bacterium]